MMRILAGVMAAGVVAAGMTAPAAYAQDCGTFNQASPYAVLTTGISRTTTIYVDVPTGCTARGPIRVQLVPDRSSVATRTIDLAYRESYPPDNPFEDRWSGTTTFQNNQSIAALYTIKVVTLDVGLPSQKPPESQVGGLLYVVRATSLSAKPKTARTLPYGHRFVATGRLGLYLGSAGNRPFPYAAVRLYAKRAGQAERVVDVVATNSDGTFSLDFPVRATETLSIRYSPDDVAVAGARLAFGTVKVG